MPSQNSQSLEPQNSTHLTLSRFVEQAPIALALLDTDLCFLATSRKWLSEHGGGRSSVHGLQYVNVDVQSSKEWQTALGETLNGEVRELKEASRISTDGRTQWFRWFAHPWYREPQKVGGTIIYADNITLQKETAELAKLLIHRAELSKEGVALLRAMDGLTFFANRPLEELLGYESGGLVGQAVTTALDFSNKENDHAFNAITKTVFNTGFWHGELVYRKRSGQEILVYTVITAETHPIHGAIWVLHTVDFQQVQHGNILALRERQRFDSLIEGINRSANLVFTDLRGTITYANDRFCELTGYSREQLIGKTHRIVNSGVHSSEFFKELWTTILAGEVWNGEICNKKKDGTLLWMETTIVPLHDQDGDIEQFMAVRFDTSAQKIIQAKLANSAKMAALGEMAGGISHEINNPLTVISASAFNIDRLLRDDPVSKEKILANTSKIGSYVDRIARTIRGMKSVARESRYDELESYPVGKILDETMDVCDTKIKSSQIQVSIAGARHLRALCRPTEVSQILINLLNNSCDAIARSASPWIRIETSKNDKTVEIRVTDSGNGVPAEVAKQIFQPFFTTKAPGKGTGLGLSISKGIAEKHGGDLQLDANQPNTSFVLSLPAAETDS